ncbi:hypothetical protein AAFF_G00045150 [Aldrovandia affinis]|uniref:Xin actin-binding repeat-containing protein 2 n=1 Tax=Aldrovandia affinis TaxID=143900 RepID=A0AAD7S249_9TELE|nr:hypothetical protein AAFF_G00045150 [Aldrovandia affinis]
MSPLAAGGVGKSRTGLPEESDSQGKGAQSEEAENVPLKERMAMYQAAVSKMEAPGSSSGIDLDYNQIDWDPVVNVMSKASAGRTYETSVTRKVGGGASASASAYGSMEQFPPPPPDLMHGPLEVPQRCCSPELPEPTCTPKYPLNKEQYSKQRNLYELKRLYKHIHPEVRRNLERDIFSEVTELEGSQLESGEEELGDVRQARYVFENTGNSPNKSMSPEREYLEWDEILKGEVQSMRWMFENKPLDSIKDETPDEDNVMNIAQQEIIAGNDVRYTAWMFETQPMDALGTDTPDSTKQIRGYPELARGDVRTATWLFETQSMDTLNKLHQEEEQTAEVVYTQDITGGDVKTARYLFETQHLDSLGHTETIDESHFLNLKSELEEIKGDVTTTTRMFETRPMCVIRGDLGQMLEITTIRREETEKGDVKTSRWLFDTQPLDLINKDPNEVKSEPQVDIQDKEEKERIVGGDIQGTKLILSRNQTQIERTVTKDDIVPGDVHSTVKVFMTEPRIHLSGMQKEEIVKGDLRATLDSLTQAINQTAVVEKEEVVKEHLGIEEIDNENAEKEHEEPQRVDLLDLVNQFESPAQMSEVKNDPVDIPERFGLDVEEKETETNPDKEQEELPKVDLLGLVNKFESPEQKVYIRKEPIVIAERLGSDTEDAEPDPENKKASKMQEISSFDVKAIKTFFEETDQNVHNKKRKMKQEKLNFDVTEIMKERSELLDDLGQQRCSQQSSPMPVQKKTMPEDSTEPVGFSETKSVTEQFSGVDEFGNKIIGSRSSSTTSRCSESSTAWQGLPSYAEMVRRKSPESDDPATASHEELSKNFQKACTEQSESAFTSLKFSSSEERTSRVVSRKEETVISENSSSRIRAVQGVSEEGLSDGVFDCGQTKFP